MAMASALALAFGAAPVAAAAPAAVYYNWAQFRFSSDHVGANPAADGLTASTVHKLKLKWSFPTVSFESSSPAVQGGVVYIGSPNTQGYLFALNAHTGKQVWRHFISAKGVDSSPAVANGVVYVGSENNKPGVLALRASTGKKIWGSAPALALPRPPPTSRASSTSTVRAGACTR